nr:metacaspase [Prorocentrum minimum]QZB49252.1 metacaspase [Prorocentrum minimum]
MGVLFSVCSLCGSPESEDGLATSDGQVRALIVALEYKYSPSHELSCSKDAQAMLRMLNRAGVRDITLVTDRHMGTPGFPTRPSVLQAMKEVARRTEPDDWFFWFFAGHGINVPDHRGDEADGFDQAFVTPDHKGRLHEKALLVDDDFARALDTFFVPGVKLLCVCDCCHSGTICDIDSYHYDHEIYSISAAQDDQEAEDTGRGGLLTYALRRTIFSLSMSYQENPFSIQTVWERTKKKADSMTQMQELNFQFSGTDPHHVAWPMCFDWKKYLHMAKDNMDEYEDYEKA